MSALVASNVRIDKAGRVVVCETSFCINPGELVALLGPSGCGKTSLLRVLTGLDTPQAGNVTYNNLAPAEALHQGLIGYAFQDPALLPWLTNRENIEWLRRMRAEPAPKALITELRDLAEMRPLLLDQKPASSSGGERQRASLLRTLALDVPFFALDEPFSALDYHRRVRVVARVRSRMRAKGAACVLVTHDIRDAVHFADRLLVFRAIKGSRADPPPGAFVTAPPIDLPAERPYEIRETEDFFRVSNAAHKECEDADLHA